MQWLRLAVELYKSLGDRLGGLSFFGGRRPIWSRFWSGWGCTVSKSVLVVVWGDFGKGLLLLLLENHDRRAVERWILLSHVFRKRVVRSCANVWSNRFFFGPVLNNHALNKSCYCEVFKVTLIWNYKPNTLKLPSLKSLNQHLKHELDVLLTQILEKKSKIWTLKLG